MRALLRPCSCRCPGWQQQQQQLLLRGQQQHCRIAVAAAAASTADSFVSCKRFMLYLAG